MDFFVRRGIAIAGSLRRGGGDGGDAQRAPIEARRRERIDAYTVVQASGRRWRETVPRAPREGATRDVRGGSRADRVVFDGPRRRCARTPRSATTTRATSTPPVRRHGEAGARTSRPRPSPRLRPLQPPARCQLTFRCRLGFFGRIFWRRHRKPRHSAGSVFGTARVRRRRAARAVCEGDGLCAGHRPGVACEIRARYAWRKALRRWRAGNEICQRARRSRDGEANLRAETLETSGSSSKSGHRSSKKGGSGALEPSKSENATLAIPVTPATPATPTPASVGNKRTTHASSSSEKTPRRRNGASGGGGSQGGGGPGAGAGAPIPETAAAVRGVLARVGGDARRMTGRFASRSASARGNGTRRTSP